MGETLIQSAAHKMSCRKGCGSTCSTSEPSSDGEEHRSRFSSTDSIAIPMQDVQVSTVPWLPVNDQKSIECDNFRWMVRSDFARALKRNGLPLRRYKVGKAKSCEDLWIQVVLGTCKLKKFGYLAQSLPPKVSSTLYRSVRTVVVELSARIGGNDRFLLLKHQVQEEGACRYRLHVAPEIHMFADEKPSDALVRFAVRELNLTERSWNQHFVIEDRTTFKRWQESLSFPGLLTLYDISKYRVNIQDPHHSDLLCFGLPEGNEFKTTTENSMDKYHSVFTWVSRKDFEKHPLYEQCESLQLGTLADVDELFCAHSPTKSKHKDVRCVSGVHKRKRTRHKIRAISQCFVLLAHMLICSVPPK